ncbi:glycosyltransferase family 39 protein [Arthrobacter sp. FX8]|uniref:glycosyltransferase family 39 protein n=1 Tax=Arthrobacter sp. FX8 TaxID=2997335 RepID=UPI00227D6319|nr:glycosyltransferase family 39 protein [Arthrobacter sp. FX8]WAJ31725.1 glycosyltransferase family 39 protein [Arthrobacter sp. FX8]
MRKIPSFPRLEWAALATILLLTGFLYCWGLDRNGWANAYYSAAAMAGSQNWSAFLYGSFDPGNAITVDKPPMSIWIMALSVRLFGLSSWSILLPQAFMGVSTVFLLHLLVRNRFGTAVGLLAASFMAVTPVSTVMFRYNNPDALLVLIMVAVAFTVLKAIDERRLRWLIFAGALVGAGFLTKQLQIGLILPGLVITYLSFARASLSKRLLHLFMAGGTASLVAGTWLLLVQLADPATRPFIGGSRTNSTLELALGYNGLDRLTGADASRTITSSTAAIADKLDAGFQRFLLPQFSGQFAWFLPFAVVGIIVAIWYFRKNPKLTSTHALVVFSAVWLITTATVLAYMSGIVHPYYSLTATPPLSALAASGILFCTRRLRHVPFRLLISVAMIAYLFLATVTVFRSVADFPWLPSLVAVAGGLTMTLLLVPPPNLFMTRVTTGALIGTVIMCPLLWSVDSVGSPHVGAGVTAGPGILGIRGDHPDPKLRGPRLSAGLTAVITGDPAQPGLLRRIRTVDDSVTWAAATIGAESAANLQLASGRGILSLGGFDGTDPYPTLESFQQMIREGRVGALTFQTLPPLTLEGQGEAAKIVAWVRSHYAAENVDGAELFQFPAP